MIKREKQEEYVDWVRIWHLKIWLPKRVNGKWQLVPKTFHYEQDFKAKPKKPGSIFHKKWQSKKGQGYFEIEIGRRE